MKVLSDIQVLDCSAAIPDDGEYNGEHSVHIVPAKMTTNVVEEFQLQKDV